jgi:hypothetical protein
MASDLRNFTDVSSCLLARFSGFTAGCGRKLALIKRKT